MIAFMCVPLNSQATYVPRNGELPFHIPGAPSRFPVSAFIVTSELVGRADIRHKPVATETPGRGAGPWPASIAGLGAGARRGHAQLQLPAHSRNKTRGGLRRVRLGAAVVTGGADAVTDTSATASAVHLPAMSPGDDVVVVLEDLPASRVFPAAAGGFGRRETVSGGV